MKFVGLDVHVRQTTVAVLEKETGELSRCKLRMEPAGSGSILASS